MNPRAQWNPAERRHYAIGDVPVCGAISPLLTEAYPDVSCTGCRQELNARGVVLTKVHFTRGGKTTLCKVENDSKNRRLPFERSTEWSKVTCRNCHRERNRSLQSAASL